MSNYRGRQRESIYLMKKAIKDKLGAPKRLVRKVLSRSSNTLSPAEDIQNSIVSDMNEEALTNEIQSLKDQIENLKAAVKTLQEDTEKKDEAIAKLAREKERVGLDLLKQKRSNCSIKQQLEEERTYYYKEKEIYCQEMNEMKKVKKSLSSTTTISDEKNIEHLKNEVEKLKQTIKQTLEANYNLSIKFLRMKNTKTCLKTELRTMQLEHEKLVNDYKTRIETLSSQLNELIAEKMNTPVSLSSKKYMQLVKQNSCLVYENLCLQLEVDNLNLKFEKMRMEKTKSETNSRLQFVRHGKEREQESSRKKQTCPKEHKRVRIQEETPEKLEKESKQPTAKKKSFKKEETVVKIFERTATTGVPQITIMDEKDLAEQGLSKANNLTEIDNIKKEPVKPEINTTANIDEKELYMQNILTKNSSKLTVFQVSAVPSTQSSFITPRGLLRVNSSPEIVQSAQFRKIN